MLINVILMQLLISIEALFLLYSVECCNQPARMLTHKEPEELLLTLLFLEMMVSYTAKQL